MPVRRTAVEPATAGHTFKRLPSGCYSMVEGMILRHYFRIRVLESGRWAGRYFVNEGRGGLEEPVTDPARRAAIVRHLSTMDYGVLMLLYGKQTGNCPVCGEKMSREETLAGMHDIFERDCYRKVVGEPAEEKKWQQQ